MGAQLNSINDNVIPRLQLPIIGTYRDVLTGTNYERDDFQRMLADAQAGKFSHLVIYRVDRFGRDTAEGLQIASQLRNLGIQIVPATNPALDISTPDGWLVFTFLLGMGEHEVGVLRMRTEGGMKAKLLDGHSVSLAPDGYINRRRQISGDRYEKWVEIDPERAPILRLAWDLLLTGNYSLDQICEELDQRGYLRRCGKPWHRVDPQGRVSTAAAELSKTFRNPFYAGWIISERFGITRGQVHSQAGGLVTDEEFDLGVRILAQHNHRKIDCEHPYLLQGLLKMRSDDAIVGMCCTVVTGYGGKKWPYYFSRPGHRQTGPKATYVACDKVDDQVRTALDAIRVDPERIPALKAAYQAEIKEAIEGSLKRREADLRKQLVELKEQEKGYARLWAAQKLSDQAYDELATECRAKLIDAQTALEQIGRGAGDRITDLDHAVEIMALMGKAYDAMEFESRRKLVQLLFEYLVVDSEGTITEIKLNAPFGYLDRLANCYPGNNSETTKTPGDDSGGVPHSTRVASGTPARIQVELDLFNDTLVARRELFYAIPL
jgi:hypothetical protein